MEYQATFRIDCGVSPGFGLKYPGFEERDEVIIADNDMNAVITAAKKARRFSKDYLSNPENDYTTVTLLLLYDSNRNLINQKEVLKKEGFDSVQRFEWNENRLVTKCSMLEHLLILASESAPKK